MIILGAGGDSTLYCGEFTFLILERRPSLGCEFRRCLTSCGGNVPFNFAWPVWIESCSFHMFSIEICEANTSTWPVCCNPAIPAGSFSYSWLSIKQVFVSTSKVFCVLCRVILILPLTYFSSLLKKFDAIMRQYWRRRLLSFKLIAPSTSSPDQQIDI